MRYISTFSGIGGLDRAMDAIGGECVVQVEREPYCRSILDLRWPDVPKHDDVVTYHPEAGIADLVVGGPPCQPVSHAGRRKGTADERWLWGEALRIVHEAQPRMVFFENPMGLRTLGLDAAIVRRRAKGKQLNLSMTVSTERGALSPDWVEWLMNLPIGWTDINVTEPGPLYGWESEPDIPRVGLGIANRSKRLTALGNACVPAQVIFAWRRLSERLGI